jgi:hypothetical protein
MEIIDSLSDSSEPHKYPTSPKPETIKPHRPDDIDLQFGIIEEQVNEYDEHTIS